MNEARVTAQVDLRQIKRKLLARKQELEEQLNTIYRGSFIIEQGHDPGDQTQLLMQETLTVSLQNNELSEYYMIIKALKRIDEGDYGMCLECGNSISLRRLLSYPNVTRCLACQEALEEQQLKVTLK